MPKAMVDVTIVPIGTGTTSISSYVAACDNILKAFPDIEYRLNPMTTTLHGELDRILELVRRMHEAPFTQGAVRVSTTIRIDDRRDHAQTMDGKIEAVRKQTGL